MLVYLQAVFGDDAFEGEGYGWVDTECFFDYKSAGEVSDIRSFVSGGKQSSKAMSFKGRTDTEHGFELQNKRRLVRGGQRRQLYRSLFEALRIRQGSS